MSNVPPPPPPGSNFPPSDGGMGGPPPGGGFAPPPGGGGFAPPPGGGGFSAPPPGVGGGKKGGSGKWIAIILVILVVLIAIPVACFAFVWNEADDAVDDALSDSDLSDTNFGDIVDDAMDGDLDNIGDDISDAIEDDLSEMSDSFELDDEEFSIEMDEGTCVADEFGSVEIAGTIENISAGDGFYFIIDISILDGDEIVIGNGTGSVQLDEGQTGRWEATAFVSGEITDGFTCEITDVT